MGVSLPAFYRLTGGMETKSANGQLAGVFGPQKPV